MRTSALTGQGIEELKAALIEACRNVEAHDGGEWFQLPIDRAFDVMLAEALNGDL